jgi:RNA polymerase sigma-B factor
MVIATPLAQPTTSSQDRYEPFRRWQVDRDPRAREALVRQHISLARKLATRYVGSHEPFDDLFQVACLGLVKAIDRFDPDAGYAFASFAVPTILGEIKRHFRDTVWSVHLPRGVQERLLKVQTAQDKLTSVSGRVPTVLEIAQYLELSAEEVVEALEARAARHAASLDSPVGNGEDDGGATQQEMVGAEDDSYALFEVSATLAEEMHRMPKAERTVLALRLREELTQQEIADRIGVSQMQVSRILSRVRSRLREAMSL